MNEFSIYLVSNGSMDIFFDNTLAAFTNLLAETISQEVKWRVAASEIKIPACVKNVSDTEITHWRGIVLGERGIIGWSNSGSFKLEGGVYHNIQELISKIKHKLRQFNYRGNSIR